MTSFITIDNELSPKHVRKCNFRVRATDVNVGIRDEASDELLTYENSLKCTLEKGKPIFQQTKSVANRVQRAFHALNDVFSKTDIAK